jgi:endoglucanase
LNKFEHIRYSLLGILVCVCVILSSLVSCTPMTNSTFRYGMSVAGLEYSSSTSNPLYNENYTDIPSSVFEQIKSTGLDHVKVPFDWMALQPQLGGELNEEYLSHINQTVKNAASHSLGVILDMHNFGRYGAEDSNKVVDGEIVSIQNFVDVWQRLSQIYKDDSRILAYCLMTEPYDMPTPTTPENYKNSTTTTMYNETIAALRSLGDTTLIITQLDQWASVRMFTQIYGPDPEPWIIDPINHTIYEAHMYFDTEGSGKYTDNNSAFVVTYPTSKAISDMQPYITWCKKHNLPVYFGEFGVPNTEVYTNYLQDILTFFDKNNVNWTYWAMSREGWYNSATSTTANTVTEQTGLSNGPLAPQLAIIQEYLQ